jgi:hypothetical protein
MKMFTKKRLLATLGIVIFLLGMIIGIAFIGVTTWGNLEAYWFFPSRIATSGIRGLNCPVMMTPGETGIITLHVRNPNDFVTRPTVLSTISNGYYIDEADFTKQNLVLDPGDSYIANWEFTEENAVYDRFVMARIESRTPYPTARLQGSCAIFVLDLPGVNSLLIMILGGIVCAALSLGGLYLWRKFHNEQLEANLHTSRGMYLLFVIVTIGIATSFLRIWLLSLVTLVAALVLLVSTLTLISYTSSGDTKASL